jgi:hypothetical protein
MKFIYYSFPVQLLILHVKKNKSLLLWWLLLFGIITYNIAASYGGAYLFLDPEYLGKVNFLSFFFGLAGALVSFCWHGTLPPT